ncbi:MAG: transposase [Saprospiraceae bacterium]
MENVLSVYERAYNENYPVINLDESPKQLIGQTRTEFIDSKGVLHEDYQYERKGVVDIYMITEALAGRREVLIKDNHKAITYAEVIAYIAEEMYPDATKITIVEDNLAAHKLSALYEIYEPQRARTIIDRLEIVRTPKHGSWLNIAENELSILIKHGLKNRIDAKEKLITQVQAWYKYRNEKEAKVNWQFNSKKARIKLKHLYPSFQN